MELGFPAVFLPGYFVFGTILLDEWTIMFSTLLYSTIHNINYGVFHVNDVHKLHHEEYLTNLGPDVCDVIFGTKNPLNETVENINHCIPNITIITILILFLKTLCLSKLIKNILRDLLVLFLFMCVIIYIVCTIVVYFYCKDL
jgi:hypothetical protein